jgi:hypothetical protein
VAVGAWRARRGRGQGGPRLGHSPRVPHLPNGGRSPRCPSLEGTRPRRVRVPVGGVPALQSISVGRTDQSTLELH